jgi:hypothetical protein
MNAIAQGTVHSGGSNDAGTFAALAPRPKRLEETGVGITLLTELTAKHLLESGALRLAQLASRLALAGGIVEQLLGLLRKDAHVQVASGGDASSGPRYELTERGRQGAIEARHRNSYTGPAPVAFAQYREIVARQSVHRLAIGRQALRAAMADIVIDEALLDQLGPALNSGRAIFIHGLAGTGKSYIARRLARALGDSILIPHAIAINETAVAVFDPMLHRPVDGDTRDHELRLDQGFDPRFVNCRRPVVVTGGELTLEMLDMHFDVTTRAYTAPLQLKANNGLFIIDDLGRQRVRPEALFNRWIVPMEELVDYLSLGSGRQFDVPFDVVLVFSSNLPPASLADSAFLRRIGYKIEFGALQPGDYARIWSAACADFGIDCDPALVAFAIAELHQREHVPLLACHPRDLLRMALDSALYQANSRRIERDHLRAAWRNYFVSDHSLSKANPAAPATGHTPGGI